MDWAPGDAADLIGALDMGRRSAEGEDQIVMQMERLALARGNAMHVDADELRPISRMEEDSCLFFGLAPGSI